MAPLGGGGADAQRALLRRAFAGDDVAGEFEAAKAAEVEEQLPKEDVPGLMPGWGLWAGQQREPKWMAEARTKAARKKAAAAGARRDAGLAHVVISEKWDKKAAKYGTSALPFPYKSADAYEASIRQPLGRDVNPDATFRNLTRPAVLKSAGVVIDPLRYSKGVADYGGTKGARARGVVTVAGGVPLQGEGPGGGAGGGAAGGAKQAGGGGKAQAKGKGGGAKRGGRR
ncbi:MAG: Utp14 protein-domain-containing protein [Monoraphidium minutum]|nr:MAG: Utp14 protein-domain-containing protein [Monoraphidium minutum]